MTSAYVNFNNLIRLKYVESIILFGEVINEAAVFVRSQFNSMLSVFHDIALGKDLKLFQRVAVCLLLISVVGSCTDSLSFAYAATTTPAGPSGSSSASNNISSGSESIMNKIHVG